MPSYHDLITAFHGLGLRRDTPAITHLGSGIAAEIKGGIETFMGALLSSVDNILLPAFTPSTMIIPESGPANNHMDYGDHDAQNANANIFSHALPSECGNQQAIEILKGFPGVLRSSHPIFSFYGLGLDIALIDHSPDKPYQPIAEMKTLGGWVLLAGAGQSHNFSIHYAEMLSGRKQFMRWALTPEKIVACPHYPGCPDGFHKLDYYLQDELKEVQLDNFNLSAMPLSTLIDTAAALLREDPFALLCNDLSCARCNLVRENIKDKFSSNWKSEDGV